MDIEEISKSLFIIGLFIGLFGLFFGSWMIIVAIILMFLSFVTAAL